MWIPLTADTLLSCLTGAEQTKLSTAALKAGQADVLADIASQVAKDWRGGLRRITVLDSRPGYVPDELLVHILAHFRYRAYTRLPGMSDLLDDLRVAEWTRANSVRDNLRSVSVEAPDDDYAETAPASGKPGPAIENLETDSILGW
jgi:hypothetical protein